MKRILLILTLFALTLAPAQAQLNISGGKSAFPSTGQTVPGAYFTTSAGLTGTGFFSDASIGNGTAIGFTVSGDHKGWIDAAGWHPQGPSGVGGFTYGDGSRGISINTTAGNTTALFCVDASTVACYLGNFTNGPTILRTNNIDAVTVSTAQLVRFNAYGAGTLSTDASGNITATSDGRLKFILGPFDAGLHEIEQLKTIRYKWRPESGMETAHEYAGFEAGNVRDVIPLASGQNPDGALTIQDRALMAALVNAIQQQQRQIDALGRELSRKR